MSFKLRSQCHLIYERSLNIKDLSIDVITFYLFLDTTRSMCLGHNCVDVSVFLCINIRVFMVSMSQLLRLVRVNLESRLSGES